jgi:hypothetical protein
MIVASAAELAIAAERAQLRLIGYPRVDGARPVTQRVQRLLAPSEST